jgi:AraC-like DNA-binding protein
MYEFCYRLSTHPEVPQIMPVRSAGCFVVDPPWKQGIKTGDYLQLFWCFSGCLDFEINGQHYYLRENEVFFYLPGDIHAEKALLPNTGFCWFTIDGTHSKAIVSTYGITHGIRKVSAFPETLFFAMLKELRSALPEAQYRAESLALEIMQKFSSGQPIPETTVVDRFRNLVAAQFSRQECGVDYLAEQLDIHRGTLHRIVKRELGISPTEYLASFRLNAAKKLLTQTNMPLKAIADQCGFADVNYFSKSFRKHFQQTALTFRKNHRLDG